MKKLITLIACFGLLFATTACSKEKVTDEALDQLESTISKTFEMKSFDYEIEVSDGTTNTMVFRGAFQSEGAIGLSLSMDVTAEEQSMKDMMQLYLKDDTMYMSTFGVKQKQPANLSQISGLSFDMDTLGFDKEALKTYLEEASLSGDTLHLSIKKEQLNGVGELAGNSLASIGDTSTDETKLDSLTIDVQLQDDYISSLTIEGKGKQGTEDINAKITLTLNNINKVESIDYPTDLDTYVESENSSFLGE